MHDFEERLNFSQGTALEADLKECIARMVPGYSGLRKATKWEDMQGVDYYAQRGKLPEIGFDVKHREVCPIEKWKRDDACIEYWSQWYGSKNPKNKPGWTVDRNKLCTYIIYTWPASGGRRFWIVPYHALNAAACENFHKWTQGGYRDAKNRDYITRCVYPRRAEIKAAVEAVMEGIRDWQADYEVHT